VSYIEALDVRRPDKVLPMLHNAMLILRTCLACVT
jgi:hypothetical protein